MAAHSGGVEWTSIIKPILAASYGSHNKNDVIELVKAINKSEAQLSDHEEEYETFYTAFAALAADYISSNVVHLSKSQVGVACQAARILLQFLVARLQLQSSGEAAQMVTALTQKQLLLPIRALCSAQGSLLAADLAALTAIMKNAKLPPHIKTSTPSEKEAAASKEPKRARSDLTTSILEQLTTPLQDFSMLRPSQARETAEPSSDANIPANTSADNSQDIEAMFIAKNTSSLQTLQGGDVLIDMCLNLPYLTRYIHKYKDAVTKKGFSLPASHSEATLVRHSLQSLVGDLTLAWVALSLPVLEPLTLDKLEKLRLLSMACLYCAVTNATAGSLLGISAAVSPKCTLPYTGGVKGCEDEDLHAVTVLEKSLAIFSLVSHVMDTSTRAGGHVLQNHVLLGVWTLVTGLQTQLAASSFMPPDKAKEEKGKSPSKAANRINLMKVQQGFGVLSVALSSQALTLMTALLQDLQVEARAEDVGCDVELATLDITGELTALQRVSTFLAAAPLNQLLYYLATISYRKACTLKRIQKHPPEGDNFTASDSTTYYEDDFSCSDESSADDDEDSEPILGLWFEETLAPPESPPGAPSEAQDGAKLGSDRAGSIVPEKGEPHGYIALATKIFQFMDAQLLSSKCGHVLSYVQAGLAEQQMIILAAIIRDLDRESARTDTGTISVYFGASLGTLYSEFSQALTRYAHNLLARNILSEELQATLLQHLGVSPWSGGTQWPLQVYPRTLAVLAQVLLLKPQPEKETACINIWQRLVATMRDNICSPPASFELENEDLNVEHAQLVLFLFHSLNLMQKKSVLLSVSAAISQCGEVIGRPMKDSQLLHLSRLLLLLEYLMRHLYDAPPSLLEQVHWNLLSSTSMVAGEANSSAARIYSPWADIEDNYRKLGPQDDFSMKPRFYSLAAADQNNQDIPKLDGLACNFILGTPDKLKYPQLVDTLIEILDVTNQASSRLSFTGLCAVQYCFTICWRLVLVLPPATPYLEAITAYAVPPQHGMLLHSLIWGPRTACKTFNGWMKDCLVKQGMFTQYAETLLRNVALSASTLRYDVDMATDGIKSLVTGSPALMEVDSLVTKEQLPQLSLLCLLDVVVSKIQVQIGDSSVTTEPPGTTDVQPVRRASLGSDLAVELLPHVLRATQAVVAAARCSLLHQINESADPANKYSTQELLGFRDILSVSSLRCPSTSELAMPLMLLLPTGIRTTLDKWNDCRTPVLPWNTYANDLLPPESYILTVVNTHVASLSSNAVFSVSPSLKSLLLTLLSYICDHITRCPEGSPTRTLAADLLTPLALDACFEHVDESVMRTLLRLVGPPDQAEHCRRIYCIVLEHTFRLMQGYMQDNDVDEKVLLECLIFMETLLDSAAGRQALDSVFDHEEGRDLVTVLLSVSSTRGLTSPRYTAKVLGFFNSLFATAEKLESDVCVERLCCSLSRLASVPTEQLAGWLIHVFITPSAETPTELASDLGEAPPSQAQENHRLLRSLTAYIVKENRRMNEDVAVTLLQALILLGSQLLTPIIEGAGFTELMGIMATLAEGGSGKGHVYLFTAATHWLETFNTYLSAGDVLARLEQGSSTAQQRTMQEAACTLLCYIRDVAAALGPAPLQRATSPPWEGEAAQEGEADWPDEVAHDDDESGSEDSDEDHLCNKLCTFTLTQREFMNQHWYHCHTCKMVDGVGVCSVCARVCHRGHDVTYAKYGNFFCDCGAKEDASCQALVKRAVGATTDAAGATPAGSSTSTSEPTLPSSLRRRTSSPAALDVGERDRQRIVQLAKQLERSRDMLSLHISGSSVVWSLLSLTKSLLPSVEASCKRHSPVGCHQRAQQALHELHTVDKKFEHTDQLMVPTLGSQEGAFENVRMNYSGDQGQTIRQLLSAHMIRRVAMCCLSSPHGKRQHLAVSHEKGKITVLQLSALLKQADSSKRKLTLTRLASAPIPFTVLSITGNQWNEDFLAVCGLKDCHVVTFGGNGSVSGDHLVLHPQLETGNFIIRAIWLPGKQTELALVTADFVKIYDLSKDALSPQYFFLLPTGKIRDCTFVCSETEGNHMLLMSSTGYILSQAMDATSSATCGPFYITNTLDIVHPDIKDGSGQVCGGGVSVYYSHALQLLFFSYAQGKSFVAPMQSPTATALPRVFPVNLGRASKANNAAAAQPQPLCQWSEVPNHPGLVCSVMQTSNNPVILMLKPDTFLVQEIKVVPAKAKIMDMVAIRHPSSNSEHRTTLILLCEDGSLRIYMAAMEHTGYWFSASVQAISSTALAKPPRKKKTAKAGKPSGVVTFPVDFFEHCQAMPDVEFGGNDLLQIYNTQQIKHRLNTTGMYVVSTKSAGFNLEMSNADPNLVMVGLRVLLGAQDAVRSPAYLEVLGRSVRTTTARNRWYDIPLTREESLQADKKLTLTLGPSVDVEGVTMVDSVKVYGRTKDAFGWPDEAEETGIVPAVPVPDQDSTTSQPVQLTALDRMVSSLLEVLDGCFTLLGSEETDTSRRTLAIEVATSLLTLPTPPVVQTHTKCLLAALHPTLTAYHTYKDAALLNHVYQSLATLREVPDARDLDAEAFYRLVMTARSIAVARPQNLARLSEPSTSQDDDSTDPDKKTGPSSPSSADGGHALTSQLMDALWRLHAAHPANMALAPVCVPGLTHVEATVSAVVEIVHALTRSEMHDSAVSAAARQYVELLLCADQAVSFSAKQAVVRSLRPRRRRVLLPPAFTQQGGSLEAEPEKLVSQQQASQESVDDQQSEVDAIEHINMLAVDNVAGGSGLQGQHVSANVLEALLDIPPDADDETMVELAIALSLQDHEGGADLASLQQHLQIHNLSGRTLQSLEVLAAQGLGPAQALGQEAGHYSDTTASAGGSDDEGSTAATDGSTLRTSPAEQGGSESGGSGVDSIEHNVSGRSSAYGDATHERGSGSAGRSDGGADDQRALHSLRLALLDRLVQHVPRMSERGGVIAIPFMQVVLALTSDLDGQQERDKACLDRLLSAVIGELRVAAPDTEDVCARNKPREVHLVILRLLSVLMARPKASSKAGSDNSVFVAAATATMLLQAGIVDYCLKTLKTLLAHWKSTSVEERGTIVGGALLKAHTTAALPDMAPFFMRNYVREHPTDQFESYAQLLTEMVLRLPYQVQKLAEVAPPAAATFPRTWHHLLCEYMMCEQAVFVRRHVRKLLMHACGSRDKYRQLRDMHALESHMKCVMSCCASESSVANLPYDSLVELVEHLKSCVEVATGRTGNWQRFCSTSGDVLAFLMRASCDLEEGVAATILQLLQCAICGTPAKPAPPTPASRKERDKSEEPSEGEARFEEAQCAQLVVLLSDQVPPELTARFVRTFLLETNATNVRWQAHALVLAIYKNSKPSEQESLLNLMWTLWPQLPAFGRKAAQFVDLLGYFSLKTTQNAKKLSECMEQAVLVLRTQNEVLAQHPNASLYVQLAQYVELDGYYLESEPCLVCNNPEVPLASIKLSSIKVDSKFTTTTQIVKLAGSHTISKITLRISELKRTKMVRTINIYYNNRCVQAVVELKNKPAMWHKAKKVAVSMNQTEVKMEFPLPIVACNLMIEYADFYENMQASSETLQCPRCSASVPANPGVCANCGENVFQCHKCRAINYDEKDPFLCHACGFCKYAKFDYTLSGRATCAVDPIENDDDRKKTVASINSLLEKADRVYKQLIGHKPTLETCLVKISEHRVDRVIDEPATGITSQVNRAIQMLAQRYCTECKTSFEELSKIIQRVLACRRELVAFDQRDRSATRLVGGATAPSGAGRCYGCATAATEHCLTLLRALALTPASRQLLCAHGLARELLDNNLRRGTMQVQEEVRQLLCLLTRDNACATEDLHALLMDRIGLTLRGRAASSDLACAVRHEMALLAALVSKEDSCWEQKLRCVMQLFLMACKQCKSPMVMQSIILPCLKILQNLIKPDQPASKKNKDKSIDALATIRPSEGVRVDVSKWLAGDPKHSFRAWRQHMPARAAETTLKPLPKEEARSRYLQEKYAARWRQRSLRSAVSLRLTDAAWLKQVVFNPSSRLARQVACHMLESLCQVPVRKREILDLLTGFLGELGSAGESASEFLALYQSLIAPAPWKQYLAVRGVLAHLAQLLTAEITELHRLEEATLTSDLAQGYALKMLTELLASFLQQDSIKQQFKGRLVGSVLNGYLSLRRLVVQRTRLVDETQEKLLELLEGMTSGTEEETKAFMAVCIETVQKYAREDVRTPVFVFERLCSIIYPEENDVGEFFLTLEKDPQQEDFLQGRMLGNPYSSMEPGLGPRMRDVKNKICADCELVALLEDDNGMELLVNNKIISLDLPVREVFKKVWVAEGGEGDAMRVVYRMRGLLGDATEEFVETLDAKSEQEVNNEEVYKMANVMADCGGLQIMLDRLSAIKSVSRARPLLHVLLKLFRLCVKVRRNQEVLTRPELGAVTVFLDVLQLCLESEDSHSAGTEQLLDIMETILSKAASQPLEEFVLFSQTFGGCEHVRALLGCTTAANVRSSPSVLLHLTRVLAALTYGSDEKMALLCQHFQSAADFNRFDFEHLPEDEYKLELLCVLTAGVERNAIGNTLKDHLISLGMVRAALDYITMHAPSVKPTLLRTDSEEWKEFISKPALKYILRFLTGLATDHEPTQLAVSADCIPVIHRLEQVSSNEHVGSLAENLLEALRTNAQVASRIEEVREQTRAEKKRLAMAMREKQLGALGMRTNDKGQVTAKSTLLMEDLGEETGLVCVICREGYKFQPTKTLGIYTFTKRANLEEFEARPRKTVGYNTVTHFNVVHVECHMAAVRLARARDEWESAALQNANTKCNGLLPLWGPQVAESSFASCLARHNTYLQECTGHRDISYSSTIHDLKLLLLRFAQEKSFHDDTGGGGPQSNIHLIPYVLHMALYVVNSTRSAAREDKNLSSYLECVATDKWLELCYEADGPLYWATMALMCHSPARWARTRHLHLRRLVVLAHTRHVQPTGPAHKLADVTVKDYTVYKSYLVFFGLIDAIYNCFFKKVVVPTEDQWSTALADYIRHNDEAMLKASERLLATYREELITCTSFEEFCDVTSMLSEINSEPNTYMADVFQGLI